MINSIKSTYWILTQDSLKIIVMDHDKTCIENMRTSGTIVKTVPLERIIDSGLGAKGSGFCNADVDSIYINTASWGIARRREAGVALQRSKDFVDLIMQQQRLVRNGNGATNLPAASAMAMPVVAPMKREGNKDVDAFRERLAKFQDLVNEGIITQAEFETKRAEMLASL